MITLRFLTRWLVFFFVSMMLVLLADMYLGLVYDAYEKIIPHVISVSVEAGEVLHLLSNNDFGLLQFYMLFQRHAQTIDVFSWGKVFFLAVSVASILFASFLYLKTWKNRLVVWVVVITLLAESILIVGNVRISMLLSFAAFLILFVPDNSTQSHRLVLFYCLIIFAVLNRIETALIVSFIGLVAHLIFQAKQRVRHSVAACFIGIISLMVFHAYNYTFHRFAHTFISTERALADQQNSTLRATESGGGLIPVDATTEELVQFATAFFVLDEPIVNVEKVEELVRSTNILDAMFNDTKFLNHFLSKIYDLLSLFSTDYLFVVIGLFVLLLCSYPLFISNKRVAIHKVLAFFGVLLLPFVITISAEVPEGFLTVFLSSIFIGLTIYVTRQRTLSKMKMYALYILVILSSLGSLIMCTLPRHKALMNIDMAAVRLRKAYTDNSTAETQLSVLTYMDDALFRTRLFSMPYFVDINYLSFGPYDQSNIFRKRMEAFYGGYYGSLAHRIKHVADEDGILACSDETFMFFSMYLDSVHSLKLDTVLISDDAHERVKLVSIHLGGINL